MTTFRIKETGKIETLTLIDANTGCCWLNDAMAGDTSITPFECDESYEGPESDVDCNQETFDWWAEVIPIYEAADNRWHELKQKANGEFYDHMESAFLDIDGSEFNDYPYTLNTFCEEWEKLLEEFESGDYFVGSDSICQECLRVTLDQWTKHLLDSGWYSDWDGNPIYTKIED